MKHIVARAAKGDRAAMQALVDSTIHRVYPFVFTMLDTDNDITAVCESTYRSLWATVAADASLSEEQVQTQAVTTAAALVRQALQRKDAKAFRMPSDRRFNLRDLPAWTPDPDQPLAVETIHALPPLHRFIVAGQLAGGLTAEQLAGVLKLDSRTMAAAIDAQPDNMAHLLTKADVSLKTYDELVSAWKTTTVPPSAEATVAIADTIHTVAAPKEKVRRRKTWKVVGITTAVCVAVLGLCALVLWDMTSPDVDLTSASTADTSDNLTDDTAADDTTTDDTAVDVAFSTDYTATHTAEIVIQDYGTITLELDGNMAPETVANFESLANSGFYNGLTFHRIMEDFMMQGGDPLGTGGGGSDQNVVGEFASNGYENTLTHTRGAISMARSTDYNSGSSQFFIVHEDSTFLDGEYAAFGYVTDGIDVVDAVCESAEPTDDNGTIPTEAQPIITSVTVTAL